AGGREPRAAEDARRAQAPRPRGRDRTGLVRGSAHRRLARRPPPPRRRQSARHAGLRGGALNKAAGAEALNPHSCPSKTSRYPSRRRPPPDLRGRRRRPQASARSASPAPLNLSPALLDRPTWGKLSLRVSRENTSHSLFVSPNREEAMKVASLAAGALLFAALMVPAAAKDRVGFIKKPKPLGAAVSSVTTVRQPAGR